MFNPDQNRLAPTLAMIMAASLVGFITGYTVPLISLELAQQQIAPLYVGLLAALPPAGMMISSFLSPALCRRVEMGVLLSGSLILLALATIASCMTTDMTLLLLPRLLTGLASGVIIVLGESWITGGAAGSQRATLTGLYASAFTGCQLAGPLLISVGPAWQTSALIAIVAVTAVCLLMLRHLPTGTRESLGERASWRSLGAFLPVLASGVFCFAFFDASILALLPLYGMDKGLNEGLAVLLLNYLRFKLANTANGFGFCASSGSSPKTMSASDTSQCSESCTGTTGRERIISSSTIACRSISPNSLTSIGSYASGSASACSSFLTGLKQYVVWT